MLLYRDWLAEANLTLIQFIKRVNSNLGAFYDKVKNGDTFETEEGTPIKLSGLAIREKGKKPIVYLVKNIKRDNWVESISSFLEDPDFGAINNLYVVLDDGNVTPTLKRISVLSKTTDFEFKGFSVKKVQVSQSMWGALINLEGLNILKPRKSHRDRVDL